MTFNELKEEIVTQYLYAIAWARKEKDQSEEKLRAETWITVLSYLLHRLNGMGTYEYSITLPDTRKAPWPALPRNARRRLKLLEEELRQPKEEVKR